MNHIFKVVRCRTTGNMVAVPETAKSGKKSKTRSLAAATFVVGAALSGATAHAEINEGIKTGIQDIAIGQGSTSTGQNNIAIGQGSLSAGGDLTETQVKTLINNSQATITRITATQANIKDMQQKNAEYLQTINLVEQNKAEIARLEQAMKSYTDKKKELKSDFDTKQTAYDATKAEVDSKLKILSNLDLRKYGALDNASISKIANDVKIVVEGENSAPSLGNEFYEDYVNAYLERLARYESAKGLTSLSASENSVWDEQQNNKINLPTVTSYHLKNGVYTLKDDVGNDCETAAFVLCSKHNIATPRVAEENIVVKSKEYLESLAKQAEYGYENYKKDKDAIITDLVSKNQILKDAYGSDEGKAVLDRYFTDAYEYNIAQAYRQLYQKQTGQMDKNDPQYITLVNKIKENVNKIEEIESHDFHYGTNQINYKNYLNSRSGGVTVIRSVGAMLGVDIGHFSKDYLDGILNANTQQEAELREFLEQRAAETEQAYLAAQKALNDNQKIIDDYQANINNRTPTAQQLAAYNAALEIKKQITAQQQLLETDRQELQRIQASLANGENAIAIGANSKVVGDNSIVIGANSNVYAKDSIAIGSGINMTGTNSIAVGKGHNVSGNNSGTFGDPNTIAANNAYAFGNNNTINSGADGAFILGNNVTVDANGVGSILLGSNTSSTVANGVALGSGSVVDRANSVSVGSSTIKRQITNVAAGTQDTDAVNFAQLKTKADASAVTALGNTANTNAQAIAKNTAAVTAQGNEITRLEQTKANKSDLAPIQTAVATNTSKVDSNTVKVDALKQTKADKSYVDSTNTAQTAAFNADQKRQDDAFNAKIAELKTADSQLQAQSKANADTATALSNTKADKSAVDAKNTAQDALIAAKADKTAVDAKNAEQDALIATKVDKNYVEGALNEHTALINTKADKSYVDEQNALRDAQLKTTTDALTAKDNDLQAQITSNDADIADLYEVKADKSYVDAQNNAQNAKVQAELDGLKNSGQSIQQDITALDTKAKERSEELKSQLNNNANDIAGLKDTTDGIAQTNDILTKAIDNAKDNSIEVGAILNNKIDANNQASIDRDNILDGKITANDQASKDRDNLLNDKIITNEKASIERDNQLNAKADNIDKASKDRDSILDGKISAVDSASKTRDDKLQEQITVNNKASIDRDNNLQEQITVNNNASIDRDNQLTAKVDANNKASIERDNVLTEAVKAVDASAKDRDSQIIAKVETNNEASIERDNALSKNIATVKSDSEARHQAITNVVNENHKYVVKRADGLSSDITTVNDNSVARDDNLQGQIKTNKGSIVDLQAVDAEIKQQNIRLQADITSNDIASVERDNVLASSLNEIDKSSKERDAELQGQINVHNSNIKDLSATDVKLMEKDVELESAIAKNRASYEAADKRLGQDISNTNIRVTSEVARLDEANAQQDKMMAADQERQDALIAQKLNTKDFEKYQASQQSIDEFQSQRIEANSQTLTSLGYKINNMKSELSGGVANAVAMANLPMPVNNGDHMTTFGTGYYDGQSSIAIGLAGSSETGKVAYKISGSYSNDGGSAFGAGAGYRWNR